MMKKEHLGGDAEVSTVIGLLNAVYNNIPRLIKKTQASHMTANMAKELVKCGQFLQQQSIEASIIFLKGKSKDACYAHLHDLYHIDDDGTIVKSKHQTKKTLMKPEKLESKLDFLCDEIGYTKGDTLLQDITIAIPPLKKPDTDDDWAKIKEIRDSGTDQNQSLSHQLKYYQAVIYHEQQELAKTEKTLEAKKNTFKSEGWNGDVPSMEDSPELQDDYRNAKAAWSKAETSALEKWKKSLASATEKHSSIEHKLSEKMSLFSSFQEDYKAALALERSAKKKRKRSSAA